MNKKEHILEILKDRKRLSIVCQKSANFEYTKAVYEGKEIAFVEAIKVIEEEL